MVQVGEKYNRWLVIEEVEGRKQKSFYCVCECGIGNSQVITESDLKRGHTKSCGCLQKETVGAMATKHGLRNHRTYSIWSSMKTRCYNKNHESYKNYGGRGIQICDEWLDKDNGFITFHNWAIENGYSDDLTLDRIDNDGNYQPNNCRWATRKVQVNNTRVTQHLEINGQIKTPKEWREFYGLSKSTYKWRLSKGWDIVTTLTTPARKKVKK